VVNQFHENDSNLTRGTTVSGRRYDGSFVRRIEFGKRRNRKYWDYHWEPPNLRRGCHYHSIWFADRWKSRI